MNKPNTKKTLFALVVGVVLIAATLAACAPAPQAEPESPNVAAPQEVERVTLEEGKAALDSGAALFLEKGDKGKMLSSYAAYNPNSIGLASGPGVYTLPIIPPAGPFDQGAFNVEDMSVNAGGVATSFNAQHDVHAPEPGTTTLWGLAIVLASAAGCLRRRKAAA